MTIKLNFGLIPCHSTLSATKGEWEQYQAIVKQLLMFPKLQQRTSLYYNQRTLTIGGSITVLLTSCLTGLDLTQQVKLLLIKFKQSS